MEITLSGDIIADKGVAQQGMVMEFSEVKQIAKSVLVDHWDHAFLVYSRDTKVLRFCNQSKIIKRWCWMRNQPRKIWH